jgi:SAM-dependent methyltransferase
MSTSPDVWDRLAALVNLDELARSSTVSYGPDIPTEGELRLLGELRGRRVVELGCGSGEITVQMAKSGATCIGVDFSAGQLANARKLAEREEVRLELRESDVADLVFLGAESVDLVVAANTFAYVADVGRALRQVHRVLKPRAAFVLTVPHPFTYAVSEEHGRVEVTKRLWDSDGVELSVGGERLTRYPHSISGLIVQLQRANFGVDQVLEVPALQDSRRSAWWNPVWDKVPALLAIRSRKEV